MNDREIIIQVLMYSKVEHKFPDKFIVSKKMSLPSFYKWNNCVNVTYGVLLMV